MDSTDFGRAIVTSGTLGLIDLVVRTPGWSETKTHLLQPEGNSVLPRTWEEVLTNSVQPYRLVVGPSGRKLLGLTPLAPDGDGKGEPHEQLVLVDVPTGHVTDTDVIRRPDLAQNLTYAISADDEALVVGVTEPGTDPGQRQLRLMVLRGPKLTRAIERTLPGYLIRAGSGVDAFLQWSPDDQFLAVQLREPDGIYDSLHILDAQTLETVIDLPNIWLMGSLSWSPDSDKLAVLRVGEPHILHLADRRLEGLSWLRGRRLSPPRGPSIIGLMSGNRALVLHQTAKRLRFVIADLATGKGPVAAAFPLDDQGTLYPTVSREWERFAGAST